MSDRYGNSRSPDMAELLQAAMNAATSGMFIALPGKIETYDAVTQTADVQPLLKRAVVFEDSTEEAEDLPILPGVPIVFPRGGAGFFISFPLAPGDNVLLVFCDRSIDNFQLSSGGEIVDPVDLRTNDISDAVAIPGFYPITNPLKTGAQNSGDLAMGFDGGSQTAFKKDGTVETKNLAGTFTLKPTGQVDINGNFTVDP